MRGEPWICPRCRQVNAPFMPFCSCREGAASAGTPLGCSHALTYSNTGGTYCLNCGKRITREGGRHA